MSEEDKLILLEEAARQTGYEVSALRRLAIKKKFPAEKFGRQWVTTQAKIDEFMRSKNYRPGQIGRPRETPDK